MTCCCGSGRDHTCHIPISIDEVDNPVQQVDGLVVPITLAEQIVASTDILDSQAARDFPVAIFGESIQRDEITQYVFAAELRIL